MDVEWSDTHTLPTKEQKKNAIREKMRDQIAAQHALAKQQKDAIWKKREGQKMKEMTMTEAQKKEIDARIEEPQSRCYWAMSGEERAETKKEIELLLKKKNAKAEVACGRKLYVGKIGFGDLEERIKLNPPLLKLYINIRKRRVEQMFESFGSVESFRWIDSKCTLFVVFDDADAAERALCTLKQYEERKERVANIAKTLKEERIPRYVAPRSCFYVR